MPGCCEPRGAEGVFTSRFARRRARRYRRRGLDGPSRRLVGLIEAVGVRGAEVLEIGGGIGEIQIELLRRGASRAVNLELAGTYEDEARRLLQEAGLSGRVERRLLDIAAAPERVPSADVVVLNRVVCCYPDYRRLLSTAADHARSLLVFSHPPSHAASRALIAVENALLALAGKEFRTFAHPVEAMRLVPTERGMRPTAAHDGGVWQLAAFRR